MASVSLASPMDEACFPSGRPVYWWRQAHSYIFVGVVAGEIGLTWGGARLVENVMRGPPGWHAMATAAMIACLFSQCFLLGLWAALGGLSTVPRWLAVGAVCTFGAVAMASEVTRRNWSEFFMQAPAIGILAALSTASFAVVLLPLRRLAGWRVDFDAAYHPQDGRRRGQLDLMDFAALTCAVALPLTLGRALAELLGSDVVELAVFVPIAGAVILIIAAPTAYAVLARQRAWLWLTGILLWVVALSSGYSHLATYLPDLNVFGGMRSSWGMDWTILAFHSFVAVSVALPLGILRLCGLKLLVVA